jgi:hypothetical protein
MTARFVLVVPTGPSRGPDVDQSRPRDGTGPGGIAVTFVKPMAQPPGSGDDHSTQLVRLTTRL